MPQYDFQCATCQATEGLTIPVSQRNDSQTCVCGGVMSRVFIAANWSGQMVLRGEWPGKTIKEKGYRKKRYTEMGRRQRERYGHTLPTLAPNVNGERVETWADAKKIVKEKGGNVANFDQRVHNLSGKKTL